MDRRLLEEKKSGSSELQLWENFIDGKKEFELVINGVFIMATYNGFSSQLLVRNGLEKLIDGRPAKILIGGLGMGYSVKEACLHPNLCRVDVVELEPTVVEWNRKNLLDINEHCLDDPRVCVKIGDFFDYVMHTADQYDLIAMDIDNGPMMLVKESNQRVYGKDFFNRVKDVIKPGGVFAVWSCNHEPGLTNLGNQVFPSCTMETVFEEHNNRRVPYFLYFMS